MVGLMEWRSILNEGIVEVGEVERVPQHGSLRTEYVKSRSWRGGNC